jgi:hypothetical protein
LKVTLALLFDWVAVSVNAAILYVVAKLRKATFRHVCLSARSAVRLSAWNNSAPTGWIFTKCDIRGFVETVEKIQVSLKSDKNDGNFT